MPFDPVTIALNRLPEHRRPLAVQFVKFAVIGTLGFLEDAILVNLMAPFVGPYVAGVISFVIVGSINWGLNRVWTYGHLSHEAAHRQLVRFLIANTIGFVINRGTYFGLITWSLFCRDHLTLPVAAGGIAGMFLNFFLSRRLVFR